MKEEDQRCQYNLGVTSMKCFPGECRYCGWNPTEDQRRREILRSREERGLLQKLNPLRV